MTISRWRSVFFGCSIVAVVTSGMARAEEMVVAESRFGKGTISAPIRQSATGYEVRLPGGTWMPCRRSCSETLRVETIDFWEAQSQQTHECGIFGCLELSYPRR